MFKNIFRKNHTDNQPVFTKTKRLDYFADTFGNVVELLAVVDKNNAVQRYEVFTHLDMVRLGKTMNVPGVTAGTVTFPATEQGKAAAQKRFYQNAYNMLDEEEVETERIRDRALRNPELCFVCA